MYDVYVVLGSEPEFVNLLNGLGINYSLAASISGLLKRLQIWALDSEMTGTTG
jgi:hypothetical protein